MQQQQVPIQQVQQVSQSQAQPVPVPAQQQTGAGGPAEHRLKQMPDGNLIADDGKPVVVDQISASEIDYVIKQLEGQGAGARAETASTDGVQQQSIRPVDPNNLRGNYAGQSAFIQTSMENTIYTKRGVDAKRYRNDPEGYNREVARQNKRSLK